jgi:hypothetical protein
MSKRQQAGPAAILASIRSSFIEAMEGLDQLELLLQTGEKSTKTEMVKTGDTGVGQTGENSTEAELVKTGNTRVLIQYKTKQPQFSTGPREAQPRTPVQRNSMSSQICEPASPPMDRWSYLLRHRPCDLATPRGWR